MSPPGGHETMLAFASWGVIDLRFHSLTNQKGSHGLPGSIPGSHGLRSDQPKAIYAVGKEHFMVANPQIGSVVMSVSEVKLP